MSNADDSDLPKAVCDQPLPSRPNRKGLVHSGSRSEISDGAEDGFSASHATPPTLQSLIASDVSPIHGPLSARDDILHALCACMSRLDNATRDIQQVRSDVLEHLRLLRGTLM